jgi:glucose-6-phosphate-specific signal transduction histidine kinase
VTPNFNAELMSAFSRDSHALSCALEVIREAINNAVRHAEAKRVEVSVETAGNLLQLRIRNDGNPLNDAREPGFGSQLIKDVTHTCELLRLPQSAGGFVTELRATVVLAPAS